jgi:hypothetical protein
MKCIADDGVVLSRPLWGVHCRRRSAGLRSGPASRDTGGILGTDKFYSRRVLVEGVHNR